MPGGDVVFRVNAQNRPFIEQMMKGVQAIDAMAGKLQDVDKRGGRADVTLSQLAQRAGVNIARAAVEFAGVGSVLAGIYTTVQLLRDEYQHYVDLRKTAYQSSLSISGKQAELAGVMGGPTELNKRQREIGEIIQLAGQDSPTAAYDALITAFSAAGTLPPDQRDTYAIEAARTAVLALRRTGDPRTMVEATQGLMAMGTAVYERTGKVPDPKEIMSQLMAANAASFVRQMKDLASDSMRIASQFVLQGESPERALALTATAAGKTIDPEGRTSGQMAATLVNRLREMSASHPTLAYDYEFNRKLQGMAPTELLEFVRSNDAKALEYRSWLLGVSAKDQRTAAFARDMGWTKPQIQGEEKTEFQMREAIDPAGSFWKSFENASKVMDDLAGSGERAAKYFAEQSGAAGALNEIAKVAEAGREMAGAKARASTEQGPRAAQGFLIELAGELSRIEGDSALASRLRSLSAAIGAGGMGVDEAIEEAMQIVESRMRQKVASEFGGGGTFMGQSEGVSLRGPFKRWFQANYPEEYQDTYGGFWNTIVAPNQARAPQDRMREFIRERMHQQPFGETYLRLMEGLERVRSLPIAPPAGPQATPSSPSPRDQSMLQRMDRMIMSMERLTGAIESHGPNIVQLSIDDTSHRARIQGTDRPLPLSRLHRPQIG